MLLMIWFGIVFMLMILPVYLQANVMLYRGFTMDKGGKSYIFLSIWLMMLYSIMITGIDYVSVLNFNKPILELRYTYLIAGILSVIIVDFCIGKAFIEYVENDKKRFGKMMWKKILLVVGYLFQLTFI